MDFPAETFLIACSYWLVDEKLIPDDIWLILDGFRPPGILLSLIVPL